MPTKIRQQECEQEFYLESEERRFPISLCFCGAGRYSEINFYRYICIAIYLSHYYYYED